MSIKHKVLASFLFINTAIAIPPFEVLRSCIDEKPRNTSITITDIDNGYYLSKEENGCEKPYEIKFNKKNYGSVYCNEVHYLIINDQKIDLRNAENMSINPEIKPGILYPTDTSWLKMDFKNDSYLCLNGPISLSGTGSSVSQYYIVENAFKENSVPVLYYYFFEKDIIPIDSPNF